MLIEEILSPVTFLTEWTSIGVEKYWFWLIFLVSFPPSIDFFRIPTLIDEQSKSSQFTMPSTSMS